MDKQIRSVDEYINNFPEDVRAPLEKVRATIKEKAPGVVESISYGMPAYKLYGRPLVYFAGYKKHIGLYATPSGHSEFAAELSGYKQGKGSVQFPLEKPIPYELIARIVEFRVKENKSRIKKVRNG